MPEFVKSIGIARFAAIAGVGLAAALFFLYLVLQTTKPPMALLFSGLEPRDSSAIVAKLDTLAVEYELKGDGSTILVPQDQALRLRMELASDSLPAGGSVGYEIFDNGDALGATSFVQNVNLLRALEGELARTIRALDVVEQARVHLAIPERQLFERDKRLPTASVVIRPRGGRISAAQVQAIQHLVAAAVDGMTPDRVSVVDEKGALLAGGEGAPDAAVATQDRTAAAEERIRAQIEQIVSSIVGPGRARVQVSADIDYNRVTRESVTYDPDGQVVRSTQTRTQSQASMDGDQAAAVTVATGLPDAEPAPPPETATPTDQKESTDETVNYEISTIRETQTLEAGRVKRLSVAVVVDGSYTTGADGTRTYQPRADEEIQKILTLVRSAIGFDATRGDSVEVVNMKFAEMEAEALPEPEEDGFMGIGSADLMQLVQLFVTAIIGLLAIFLVFRPMMKRLFGPLTVNVGQLGGPVPAGALAGPGGSTALTPQQQQALQSGDTQTALLSAPRADSMIDIARVQGQVKESSIKKVGEIVTKHPDEAVSIMRAWLHETT